MFFQLMAALIICGTAEPMAYPENPSVVLYVIREMKGEESYNGHFRQRLYMSTREEKGYESTFLYETDDEIEPNATYLTKPQAVASAIGDSDNGWTLRISDTFGKTLREKKGIHARFSTNVDGTKIVYITGHTDLLRDHRGYPAYLFVSTGVWILDVDTGDSEQISSGGRDVYWSTKEDCIYLSPEENYEYNSNPYDPVTATFEKTIVKYDPKTKRTTSTKFGTCRFSSGESYYVSKSCDGMMFGLHKTDTNENIGRRIPFLQGSQVVSPSKWLSDTILLMGKDIILDCRTGVVKRIECRWFKSSEVLGTADKGTAVLVRTKDHTVTKIPLKDIPDINPDSWRPVEYTPAD